MDKAIVIYVNMVLALIGLVFFLPHAIEGEIGSCAVWIAIMSAHLTVIALIICIPVSDKKGN